ncbi:NAD(P)/FAD-dependent oxidoreductase [Acholeplasma sp. OttesenSCG-928-E16]|nr:NAD(P)/FAD-dependent oxidoreductase [Acholeplasma sp. OttesenSCG-928-E16]
MYDYVIIGAGIIGTAVARELSKYQLKILVVEKECDVSNGQTSANSAIIHSGHDPKPGTLKAKLCVRGNEMYEELEKELDIPLLYTGAYVLARSEEDLIKLEDLYQRAKENGVKKAKILSKEEAFKNEPNLSKDVISVLSLPTTKVTYPWEAAFALMENAIKNGASLKLNSWVTKISKEEDVYIVEINGNEKIKTKGIINAAGVHSDIVANYIDQKKEFLITPRKGEYLVLDKITRGFIHGVIYPLPTEKGKGVLLVPQVHGNILVGPTSTFIDERDDLSNTLDDLNDLKRAAKELALNIPFDKTIRTFAGVRATSPYEDFYIKESCENKNVYHLGGIDSPGLTAAPAIAEYLVELIKETKEIYPKKNFDPYRNKNQEFDRLPISVQKKLIKGNPRYGKIICKCEHVTEEEIIEGINGHLGNDTIKGIKKRTRAGTGLCQGGYCENAIIKIIARERKVKLTDVNYYNPNTPILLEETKVKKND